MTAFTNKNYTAKGVAALYESEGGASTTLLLKEAEHFIGGLKAEGLSSMEAIKALLVGSDKCFTGAGQSIRCKCLSIQKEWLGGLLNGLEKLKNSGGPVRRMLQEDKTLHDNIVREMILPQSTHDPLAGQVADILRRSAEQARLRLNSAGANIGQADGWAPQSHDPWKVTKKPEEGGNAREAWITFTAARLDRAKTFAGLPGTEAIAALGAAYDRISIGQDGRVSTDGKQERALCFKDADAFFEYHRKYGRGNIIDGITHYLENLARQLSLRETLGADPQAMLSSIVEQEKRLLQKSRGAAAGKEISELEAAYTSGAMRAGKFAAWLAELSGEYAWAGNVGVARWMCMGRATHSLAKLGSATISSTADVFITAANMRVHGRGWFEGISKALQQCIALYGKREKEIAASLAILIESVLGDMHLCWHIDEALPGGLGDLQNKLSKWSGLNAITESGRAGFAMWFSQYVGKAAHLKWEKLDKTLRGTFEYNAINSARWDLVRHMVEKSDNGAVFWAPGQARYISDEVLAGYHAEDLKKLRQRVKDPTQMESLREQMFQNTRRALQSDSMSMLADETMFAVKDPQGGTLDVTPPKSGLGTRQETLAGEMWRMLVQFNSFPVDYIQRRFGGLRWAEDSRSGISYSLSRQMPQDAMGRDMPAVVGFILACTAFGYAAIILRDLAQGRQPRDPRKLTTALGAFVQSGAAGIYGNFVPGNEVPPAGQAVRSAFMNTGEGTQRLASSKMSRLNFLYTKATLDQTLLYHMREMLSPGALARTERIMREEFGQGYFDIFGLALTP